MSFGFGLGFLHFILVFSEEALRQTAHTLKRYLHQPSPADSKETFVSNPYVWECAGKAKRT
jgi:hypothetical protein